MKADSFLGVSKFQALSGEVSLVPILTTTLSSQFVFLKRTV